tara:strand:+ start:438 stop:1133 length:696 start_codon:yes stop_codon:yes gene_type:complete
MKISTALILCAGYGKRLNPLTLKVPKPLLELNQKTLLENSINLIENLGINEIIINTFYLRDQIRDFIKKKKFQSNIQIIDDGINILDTGGGILNLINYSNNDNFFVFNPDTLWNNSNLIEIRKMEELYFSKSLENILLLVNKDLSFDKDLVGDFNLSLKDNLVSKNNENQFIYTGCQILNRKLFENQKVQNFSISKIWNFLLENKRLYGYESLNKFYHITNLKTFKKLKDL